MIEYSEEKEYGARQIVTKMAEYILEEFGLGNMKVEIQVSGDQRIQELNKTYRNIDKTTDVLSFPNFDGGIQSPRVGQYLGSIAISHPKAVAQAEEYGHSLARELAFLTTHGMLHLLGFDHQTAEQEREMSDRARQILEACHVTRDL